MSLSDRLQAAMQAAGMNQAELARKCGVKPPSIHGWLSGKSKFLRGENLLKAASTLGVSPKWLAEGIGPMRPTDSSVSTGQDAAGAPPMDLLSPEALQLAQEFDSLKPIQKRAVHAMLAAYIRESTAAPRPFRYNKKTNVAPFSPAGQVGRGIGGKVRMIGNVSPTKGAKRGKSNKHPRVPGAKRSGNS